LQSTVNNHSFFFLRFFIYIFDREKETAREGTQAGGVEEGEGEAGFPLSREPDSVWGSIPGPWDHDHDLSRRQIPKYRATQAPQ